MDQPGRGLQSLAAAVAMDPDSVTYLFNLANGLATVGQLAEAEATFRHCIGLAPTLAGAHSGLGIVLAESGRLQEAVSEFRIAVGLQPNDPGSLSNLKRAEDMLARRPP
jgi:Flp pilus assembly protein TadD